MSEVQLEQHASKFKKLALPQDFASEVVTTKILTKVPIKRPHRQDWFRVHPDPEYRHDAVGIIQLHEDDEMYIVMPEVSAELADLWQPFSLYTAMTRQGVCFIIPVRLKGVDDKEHDCSPSAPIGHFELIA